MLSAVGIPVFIGTAVLLAFVRLPETGGPQVLHHSALRIAILAAIGSAAGFSLKMLRAYMHMRERNLHRQRIANSIEAFVVSAQTPEVRDVILAQLVDSVVAFGTSGLLTRDSDAIGPQRLPAEVVARLITGLAPKKDRV